MSYISYELAQVANKLIKHKSAFHSFMLHVEDECKTVNKTLKRKEKLSRALCLRGYLETTLDASGINLSEKQLKRVNKQKGILTKTILGCKIFGF